MWISAPLKMRDFVLWLGANGRETATAGMQEVEQRREQLPGVYTPVHEGSPHAANEDE